MNRCPCGHEWVAPEDEPCTCPACHRANYFDSLTQQEKMAAFEEAYLMRDQEIWLRAAEAQRRACGKLVSGAEAAPLVEYESEEMRP